VSEPDQAPAAGPPPAPDGRVPKRVSHRLAMTGAVFLMAMSAVGPGFLTQTAKFTDTYGASFAAVIVLSVVIDLAVQLNVWRVIGLSGLRAQDLSNVVLPGSGYVLAGLIVTGGIVFTIANIAGVALGLHNLTGIDLRVGAVIGAALAILVFSYKAFEGTIDKVAIGLGAVKIGLIAYVAIATHPPVLDAAARTIDPHGLDFLPVLTLIGGTVGGYITYAGPHRLIESGTIGPDHLRRISRGSVSSILITGVLRLLLFLGVLGAVVAGAKLNEADPAGSVFRFAGGETGARLFGLVLFVSGLISTLGASFTSASFVKTLAPPVARRFNLSISLFITVATVAYLILGETPTELLVFAGAFNGLILPFGLAVVIWVAWRRRDLLGGARYPPALLVLGAAAWVFTVYAGWESLRLLPTIFS
jgi:Mn2+/Fe2+ NRAMP family transporter